MPLPSTFSLYLKQPSLLNSSCHNTSSYPHQYYPDTWPSVHLSFLRQPPSPLHSTIKYLLYFSYPTSSHTPHHMPSKPHILNVPTNLGDCWDCLHISYSPSVFFLYKHKVNFCLIFIHSECHLPVFFSLRPCI